MRTKLITSAQNEQFRLLMRASSEPRFRRKHGWMWIEGQRLVEDFLGRTHGLDWQPVSLVLAESQQQSAVAQRLMRGLDEPAVDQAGLEVLVLSEGLFGSLSQLAHGPGIGLLAQSKGVDAKSGSVGSPVIRTAGEAPVSKAPDGGADLPDVVLMDRVSDPGNLGGLLRSAAAAGCGTVWLLEGSAEAHSPKALRAGMGAQFGLRIIEDLSLDQLGPAIGACGGQLVLTLAASGHRSVDRLDQASWMGRSSPLVWAFGQEGDGLCPTLLDWPDALAVTIDQSRLVESLNVNAAAAVCLFERRRRLSMA
jgi:TrmH family RNA methyltransferase